MADNVTANPASGGPAFATRSVTYSGDVVNAPATGLLEFAGADDAKTVTDVPIGSMVGAVNETAPASDTASSGLNGRLQRVAQRATDVITAINNSAGSLGPGTAAAAIRTTLPSDDPAVVVLGATNGAAVVTDADGTIQRYLRGIVKLLITSGTIVLGAGTAAIGKLSANSGVDIGDVDVTSSALPSGASTSANQSTEIAALGSLTETAPASDTASSGLNGRLQRVAQRIAEVITAINNSALALGPGTSAAAGRVVIADQGLSASATFTPAATSHTAGDCNGAAGTFALGAVSAGRVMITGGTIEIDGATAEATAWRLYLYRITPPSATADDAAWTYADADRSDFLGYIDIGTAIDYGPNQWAEQSGINKQIKLAGTSVFGYLVNLTTLTPAAVAHIVTIHAVQL